MSDGRHLTEGCLDAETLAAFMDGRLEPRERAVVEAHLAECEDCYEVWMEAVELTGVRAPVVKTDDEPSRSRFTRTQQWAAVAGLAASIAAIAWLGPSILALRDPAARATRDMREAVGDARFAEARLSASFDWGVPPASMRGSTTKPAASIQQAALAATRLTENASNAVTLRAAGTGHLILGEFDEAVASFEESLTLDPSSGLADIDLGAALYERWRFAGNPVDAARSVEALERARTKRAGDEAVLFNLALALEATGRFDDAVRTWESFLKIDSQSAWAAEARDRLARLRERRGSPPIAKGASLSKTEIAALAAQAPWRLLDYLEQVAVPDWVSAVEAGATSDLSQGMAMAESLAEAGHDRYSLDLLKVLTVATGSHRTAMADGLRAMQSSRAAFDRSKYAEALRHAEAASRIFTQAGWTALDADMQASFTVFFQDRREDALLRSDQLGERAQALHYFKVAARAPYMRGLFHSGRAELSQYLTALTKAQRTYEEAGDRSQAAVTGALLTEAYRNLGRPEEAWSQLFAATALVDQWTRPRLRYLVLTNGFHHAVQSGHFLTAVGMTEALSQLVEEWNDPLYRADFALLEAGLYERMERPADTRAAAKRSRAFLADIPDETVRQQYEQVLRFTLARALYATAPDDVVAEISPVIARLASLNRPQQSAEAYLLRGRAHRAARRLGDAEQDWRAGLDALEREQLAIGDERLAVSRADRQWSLYGELIDLKSGSAAESLAIAERGRARSFLSALDATGRGDSSNDTVETMPSWLPGDTALLVYVVLPQRVAIWVVTKQGVEPESATISQPELQREVARYVAEVQQRGAEADSSRLSSLLIPRSWATQPSARLVIIPDSVLHQVPFGAMKLPGSARLIAESTTLSMSPSLAILRTALAQPRPVENRALVVGFGAAQPDLGLAQLPRVAEEVRQVVDAYAGRATPLEGVAATPAAVRSTVRGYTILHLAGHAFTDVRRPWLSRLFLSPSPTGDSLMPTDIAALSLSRGATVILSACSTGAGTVFRGEGAMSLARPFLAAGASAVLASQWPVRDDDAERVMIAIHRQLANGTTLADAWASVQRQELKKSPSQWQPWMVLGAQASPNDRHP